VTEQLGLEQVARQRAAIDDDERPSISTVASELATRSSNANTRRIGTLRPSTLP
jgi:hypothetical protein